VEAGLAALRWLVAGYGYEITSADVLATHTHTLTALEGTGYRAETMGASGGWSTRIPPEIGLQPKC
jgi:hypothetical protein